MTEYRFIEVHGAADSGDGLDSLLGVVVRAGREASPLPDKVGTDGHGPAATGAAGSTAWDTPVKLPERWALAAPWRAAAEQRRVSLAHDLARLDALTSTQLLERDALRLLLEDVEDATQEKVWLGKWWWGTEVERAWTRLHEVEERMVDLLPVDELAVLASTTASHATDVLKGDDKQLVAFETMRADVAAGKQEPTVLRATVVAMMRRVHAQSDRDNHEARYLRNRVLLASGVCVLMSALIVLLQRRLGDPFLTSSPGAALEGKPTAYLLLLMTFAAVGALITAIPTLSQVPSDFSPFNLPLQQAVLKVVFGPIVAVIGFAIVETLEATQVLNSDIVNLSVPTSLAGVMVLAVVLGAAQHLVTRYVDRRADEVLGAFAPDSAKT